MNSCINRIFVPVSLFLRTFILHNTSMIKVQQNDNQECEVKKAGFSSDNEHKLKPDKSKEDGNKFNLVFTHFSDICNNINECREALKRELNIL